MITIGSLDRFEIQQIAALMGEGRPWLPASTDYWLWRECFATTSFIASSGGDLAGGVLACVNQTRPEELYVDQVAVHPQWRGRGVAQRLFDALEQAARAHRCSRIWLSTDPANPATRTWPRLGFTALPVRRDFKGPGKDRALFEKRLA
jgi:GNAT superfamily N-acetyltransferase